MGEPGGTSSCAAITLPDGADGPLNLAIVRVAKLHHQLARQVMRRSGLHPGQELIMMHLWQHGPQRQVDLIRLLDSDAATMTRSVRRLERAGFVRRHPCPTDRRAIIIEATPASQALRAEVENLWPHLEELTAAGLTEHERAGAVALLGKLAVNLLSAIAEDEPDQEQ
ncbi:MAG TPA: MarR family winged helix-turn-helix transcriptional regulator [Pseudonocardiaceae bacterium]|jgi:DNA-binding MarR family transcriptional regulator